MGRASTKENKNIYQKTREALRLTREAAGDLLESITPERIEKIENERCLPPTITAPINAPLENNTCRK